MIYQMTYPPIVNFLQMIPLFFSCTRQNISANELNNDLRKISNWTYQWKISFNPDPFKQAQDVIFSRKITKTNHPTLIFNDNPVHQVPLQRHLRMFLDCKLYFEEPLKTIVNKRNKTIAYFVNFRISYQENSYLQYINPLSDYTLTMVTSFTTKVIILLSTKDWNYFNTMRVSYNRCHSWYFERKTL